jgi:Trk K+ transport system NAD-binding subunit
MGCGRVGSTLARSLEDRNHTVSVIDSEPDAFRWIQKTAMDLRLSMKQVADGVVEHGVAGLGAATGADEPPIDGS